MHHDKEWLHKAKFEIWEVYTSSLQYIWSQQYYDCSSRNYKAPAVGFYLCVICHKLVLKTSGKCFWLKIGIMLLNNIYSTFKECHFTPWHFPTYHTEIVFDIAQIDTKPWRGFQPGIFLVYKSGKRVLKHNAGLNS